MQLVIPHDSAEDCNLRWSGCFAHLLNKDNALVHIQRILEVRDAAALVDMSIYDPADGMWERLGDITEIRNEDIDLSHPEPGNVDIGSACRYVSRKAGSSYRLGCTEARYIVYTPSEQVLRMLGRSNGVAFGAVVPQLFDKKYRSPTKAIDMIMDKSIISSAITKDLSIGLDPYVKGLTIYRRTRPIGVLDLAKGAVKLGFRHRYFLEELESVGFVVNLSEEPENGKKAS